MGDAMWKKIRNAHKDGSVWMVCVEGEDGSVGIAHFKDGTWRNPIDDSAAYPEGIVPSHCQPVPQAAQKRGKVVALADYKADRRLTSAEVLGDAMDRDMDDILLISTLAGEIHISGTVEEVADFLFLIEVAKSQVMKGVMGG